MAKEAAERSRLSFVVGIGTQKNKKIESKKSWRCCFVRLVYWVLLAP